MGGDKGRWCLSCGSSFERSTDALWDGCTILLDKPWLHSQEKEERREKKRKQEMIKEEEEEAEEGRSSEYRLINLKGSLSPHSNRPRLFSLSCDHFKRIFHANDGYLLNSEQ